ncbi:uncharacterized protein LOC117119619 [Anneissia japonica]|uniref:uncharacterized protein LOC117119619 n=1 Tax=Anneissia japonica TaxID=1529436 RepID=UPI001425ADB3|nr:uncharacterized protein LOC117119619 [Anneissia japonica]
MSKQSYFFDQKIQRKPKKRSRKHPDELPRSLRFANLNPRLAAFLSQQDKQQRSKKQDGDCDGNTPRDEECHSGDDQTKTKASILPDIHGSESLFRRMSMLRGLHGGSLEDAAFEFEGDFSQKQFYKEAVVAAPGLLLHLARILYLFENEHLDLPREVMNEMLHSFKDLIKEAQYTKREWQCQENWLIHKQMQEAKNAASVQTIEENESENKENDNENSVEGEKKRRRRRKIEVDDSSKSNLKDDATGCLKGAGASHSHKSGSRNERCRSSLKQDHGSGDRLRVPSTARASNMMGKLSDSMSIMSEGFPEGQGSHQPSFLQVINFSMQSKLCEDKGWIVHQNEQELQMERETLVHWAQERLKMSILQSQEQLSRAKELGYDKPLVNRYYGDTRRENIMKYTSKKASASKQNLQGTSKLPLPKLPQMVHDSRPKFYTSLPDGCATVYYPSGRCAISISRNGIDRPGVYAIVYADSVEYPMLAVFTPYGKACCYHPNGLARFIAMDRAAIVMETDGTVTQRVNWPLPHSKLSSPIFIQLNEQVSFKCSNRNQMVIGFYCQKESIKFQVGHNINTVEPQTQENLGYLATSETFLSKAAEESVKPPSQSIRKMASFRDGKRVGKKVAKPKPSPQSQFLEMIRNMEIPERGNYDIAAEKEHSRLQRKAKNLCEDWMDHYRLALGIISPHLRNVTSGPRRYTRSINSAKSVPGGFAPCPEQVFDEPEIPDMVSIPEVKIATRVPSAPPMKYEMIRRPISSHSVASRAYSAASASSRRNPDGKVRIEVDGQPLECKPVTPAPSTCPETSAASLTAGIPTCTSPVPKSTKASFMDPNEKRRLPAPLKGCTIVIRNEIFGEMMSTCKCSRHRIPTLTDVEFERFINEEVTQNQLIVVSVISSVFPDLSTRSAMLTKLYEHQNRNRTKPCFQSRLDPYRLLTYDIANAAMYTDFDQPLLLRRHNVVPGMFLMYMNGKLVFCDHIFNGYGNAKKDFLKQVLNSKRGANEGSFLPNDFRFSPSRGASGCRSPWGGEIGGTGVDNFAGTGLPDLQKQLPNERIASASSTIEASSARFIAPFKRTTSAADFLTYSLSNTNEMLLRTDYGVRPLTHPSHRINQKPKQGLESQPVSPVK